MVGRNGGNGTLTLINGAVNVGVAGSTARHLAICYDSANNESGTVNVYGGTLNVGLVGNSTLAGQIKFFQGGASASETAVMTQTSCVVNAWGGIIFGAASGSFSGGSASLTQSGGTNYIGQNGISQGAAYTGSINITLSGGVVGALANWSSSLPMTLGTANGNITFQCSDASSDPYNISLSGPLTGAGGLNVTGGGTLTSSGIDTYTGNTAISNGTLALASAGTINNSSAISIAAGGTLDVSAIPSYALSGSTTLSASGTGTTTGSTAATIKGGNTVSLGSQPIFLNFMSTAFNGDTAHPALYISQGTLSLNGNVFIVNNGSGTALGAGSYLLIQQESGNVTSSGSCSVSVRGSGLLKGATASIQVSGGSVNLVVAQATPIIAWQNPAPITYGTALSSNQLDATANVPGNFLYNPPSGTVLNAGTRALSAIFTPADTVDFTSATDTVSLIVLKATPAVTWSTPSAITYGTALSSNQLNATANVPGTFAYIPTNGTVLNVGTNPLFVVFTPNDTVDYSSTSDMVSLVVLNVAPSSNLLPTYEPFTEYATNIATNTAGVQTNSIDLCTAGLIAPNGQPWLNQSFSGTVGTNIHGLDVQVTNNPASVFTYSTLSSLLPTNFPGFPSVGNAITVTAINPAQPLVAGEVSPNIVGNSAVLQFGQDFTRPASGTKTLFVSYLFNDVQQGQTANGNNGRYMCFVASSNVVEGLGSGGFYTGWQAMYNTFLTNAGPRYFGHAVRYPNPLDIGPTDSANGALPNPLSSLSLSFNSAAFVVGEFVFVSTNASLAGTQDTNILWLNPPLNGFGGSIPATTKLSTYPMLITMNDVGGLVLLDRPGSGQLGGVGTNYVANLILGNTWSYVTGGPEFTNQPENASGSKASLSAAAVAAGQIVTYQWQHVTASKTNNLTNGLVNPGGVATVAIATNANITTLTLAGVSAADTGSYQVVATASSTGFSLASSTASVNDDPIITVEPQNTSVPFGGSATFNIAAMTAYSPLFFQWTLNGTNISTGNLPDGSAVTVVAGSTNSVLTISNCQTGESGATITCALVNSLGVGAYSAAATLTITPVIQSVYPPVINESAGDHVAYQVSAMGTGTIRYQWYHTNTPLAGQTNSNLVLTNIQTASSGQYEITVVDNSGIYVTNSVALNVSATPLPLYATNLVVLRVGDGVQILSGGTGNTVYLDQYTTNGLYVSSLMVPDEGVGLPYGSGSSGSAMGSPALLLPGAGNDYTNAGMLTLSSNQQFLTFAGYCANYPFSGADVTVGATGGAYWRGLAMVAANGHYALAYTNSGLYSGGHHTIRSAASLEGTNFWTTGQAGSGGVKYVNSQNTVYNGGSGIPIISTSSATGTSVVEIFGTNLIYSDAAGSSGSGLYICSGTPELAPSGSTTAALLLNEGGQPNDFAISPDGRTIYIADGGTFINAATQGGGIQRWDTNSIGAGYSFSYTLPVYQFSGAQGLTVSFPTNITSWGANVLGATLFATSPANVFSAVVDNGPSSTATILVNTAPFNELLHGIRFAPPVVVPTTPIITWPNPAPITYGTALSSNQLNATANVPGTNAYNPTYGTVLNIGTNTLSVVFTPNDTVDYSSVTDTVSMVVLPAPAPPVIQTAQQSGNSFTFSWSTITNQEYQIQATASLAPANWTNLGGTIIATNSSMIISEAIGTNSQQFYRVVLLP